MTAIEKVQEHYPSARVTSYKDGMGIHSHSIIWSEGRRGIRLGTGKKASEAWQNAAKNIKDKEAEAS